MSVRMSAWMCRRDRLLRPAIDAVTGEVVQARIGPPVVGICRWVSDGHTV